MMFPKFWTHSDIDWSVKLDDSGSYEFCPLDFTQNTPNDSSHHIMMFPKFWTQSDIDCSVKLHSLGSYEVRSEMEWLVYCIVLSTGFHSKHSKSLLPPYYDVPQLLDSVRCPLFYPLDFTQNTPNDSSNHIIMFLKFWTQSDIDWSFYPLDFTQNTPNDSSHHIMMFPKFWTQSDIDWSVKLHNSGSYEVRSDMEWLFYPLDFTQNRPNDSSHHIMMFPMFRTHSDIDWSVKLEDSGSYVVRSEMEWLVYCIVLSIGFHSKHTKSLIPPYYDVPQVRDSIRYRLFYPLDFTQNPPNDYSHHIMMFPKFWIQSDVDWSVKLHNLGSYEVRSEMEWLVYCIVLSIGFHSKHTK
ncbi:unnamed protein product [Prunus armeniaca]